MIAIAPSNFDISTSPHSISLQDNITIPTPWADSNYFIKTEKRFLANGMQGLKGIAGLQGLTFDGTGLLGTGLFSGDFSTWGISELLAGVVGIYAAYSMFHQGKQTKYRMEMSAGRRRKSTATKLRAKAKRLEDQTTGIF